MPVWFELWLGVDLARPALHCVLLVFVSWILHQPDCPNANFVSNPLSDQGESNSFSAIERSGGQSEAAELLPSRSLFAVVFGALLTHARWPPGLTCCLPGREVLHVERYTCGMCV